MRAKNWSKALVTVAFGSLLAACASDIQAKVMCSTDNDCWNSAGTLYFDVDVDANADFLPKCFQGFCVVRSTGCDTAFRYLTHDPNNQPSGGYGECTTSGPDLLPPPPPPPDMAGSD